jgi:hypothetical protein
MAHHLKTAGGESILSGCWNRTRGVDPHMDTTSVLYTSLVAFLEQDSSAILWPMVLQLMLHNNQGCQGLSKPTQGHEVTLKQSISCCGMPSEDGVLRGVTLQNCQADGQGVRGFSG